MKLEAAICPNCGGDLRIPDDRKTIICTYCGKTIIVQEAIAKLNSPSVENYLELVKAASNSNNHEEELAYCNKILELDPQNYLAWFFKAEAAGWQSTVKNFRLNEMTTGIDNSIKFAPQEKKIEIQREGAELINNVTNAFRETCFNYMFEYGSDESVKEEFIDQWYNIKAAWDTANSYDPTNKDVIDNALSMLKALLEGAKYKDCDEWETVRIDPLLPGCRQHVTEMFNDYINKRRALDPSFQPPETKKKRFIGLF